MTHIFRAKSASGAHGVSAGSYGLHSNSLLLGASLLKLGPMVPIGQGCSALGDAMSLSFALRAAASVVPQVGSVPAVQPKLEPARTPAGMNTPSDLITLDAPRMDFGGMLQAPSQFADDTGYGALARTALAPIVVQHWAGPADDAVSDLMARNLSGASAVERMGGLGAALLGRVAAQPVAYAQTAVNLNAPVNKAQLSLAVAQATDHLFRAPSERVALSITTQSGATVRVVMTAQQSDAAQQGLATQIEVDGALSQAERSAIQTLAAGFEKAVQGLLDGEATLDLSGLSAFDAQSIRSVDLSAQVYRVNAKGLREKALDASFHADATHRDISLKGVEGEARISVDLSQSAVWGNAQQKAKALEKTLGRIDQAAQRGRVDDKLAQLFKSAMQAMHNSYGTRDAQALEAPDAAAPKTINLRTHTAAWSEADTSLLSGLADFDASLVATSKATNPRRAQEVDRFSYTVAQTTRITGSDASDRGVTQTQTRHLSAAFHRSLLPDLPLKLDSSNASQNYTYTQVDDHAASETSLLFRNHAMLAATLKQSMDQSTHTQRYEMGKLIDERTVPTHASRQLNLLPLLQDATHAQRTRTQERQQLLAHVHALVLADASEPWEAVAN